MEGSDRHVHSSQYTPVFSRLHNLGKHVVFCLTDVVSGSRERDRALFVAAFVLHLRTMASLMSPVRSPRMKQMDPTELVSHACCSGRLGNWVVVVTFVFVLLRTARKDTSCTTLPRHHWQPGCRWRRSGEWACRYGSWAKAWTASWTCCNACGGWTAARVAPT
jgi:hypothetical protein